MDDDKKRVDLNWQDKYYTPNEIYDNCGTLINVDKAIVECNALLQEVNLHFEYEPKLEIIEEYQSNHETLKLYIQELQAYIAEKIDTPLYKDFNKNATESISRIHMEDYEVDNTIGGVTIKDYSYQTTVKEEEKEKLTFYDFIGVNDGDINYWTGEYQEGKVEAFASIFSEQYKAYQEMGLTEGFDSEKDFMEAFFEQGEFDHKVDKPFLNFVSSVLDATIVIPIFEAAMGEDFITGEDLTDFERGMKLVFAFVDIFTFGQGKLAGESLGKLFVLNFVSNAASSATASICNELELPAPLTFLLSMGSGITVSTCGTKLIIKGSTVTKELDLSEKQMQKLGGLFEGTDDIKIKNIDVIDGVDMNGLKNTGDGIDINAMKKASDSIDVNGVKKAIDSSLETSYGESSGSSAYQSGTETSRPTWRQSELDAAKDFPDYDAQKSFINGEEVPYGTKGSVRPDYYKDGYSVDIKNYNVESASGRSNLARNIEKQYYQRIENLPEGTKQSVMIDIRGQNVTDADLSALYDDIMKRTDNGVEILFKMD